MFLGGETKQNTVLGEKQSNTLTDVRWWKCLALLGSFIMLHSGLGFFFFCFVLCTILINNTSGASFFRALQCFEMH